MENKIEKSIKNLGVLPEIHMRSGASYEARKLGIKTEPCVGHKADIIIRPDSKGAIFSALRKKFNFVTCDVCGWSVSNGRRTRTT